MAVRFCVGRARSGRTQRCLDELSRACRADPFGAPVIYLVPEQATFEGERALLATGLAGYSRAQVLSFTRLAQFVFAHGPAPTRPRLTATHRLLLATLLTVRARHRGTASPRLQAPGIEEALEDLISEARQYRLTPGLLREIARRLKDRSPLALKLEDLAGLLEEFDALAGERFEDPQLSLVTLADQIEGGDFLQGSHLYVDGFIGFTPVEERVLVALGRKVPVMVICLPGDPDRVATLLSGGGRQPGSIFDSAEETMLRLARLFRENGVRLEPPELLRGSHGYTASIAELEQRFYDREAPGPAADRKGVRLVECESPREEARTAAEIVLGWVRDEGWSPGEIGILTRNLDEYAAPLEAALEALGLPAFVDRSEPLKTHPIVVGLQTLMAAVVHENDVARFLAFAKSGLAPASTDDVDRLELHARLYPRKPAEWFSDQCWDPRPDRSPFSDKGSVDRGSELPQWVQEARIRIAAFIDDFRGRLRREGIHEGRLDTFLEALTEAAGGLVGHRRGEEEQRLLERVGVLLQETHEAAGAETMPWTVAAELTTRALGQLTLPRIPPMLDQVFVGQVDRSRQPALRGVIVLGMNEGTFPRAAGNRSLLNDADREALEGEGVDLRPSSRRQFDREILYAYRALVSATERLVLLRGRADAHGSATASSPFWNEVLRVFALTGEEVEEAPAHDDPARCQRPGELAAAALRRLDRSEDGPLETAVYTRQLFDGGPNLEMVGPILRAASWRNDAHLAADSLARFHDRTLSLSASQLDTYGACPFRHFVSYLLRPREILEPEFEQRDAGNFAHAALRNFTATLREEGLLGKPLEGHKVEQRIDEAMREPREALDRCGVTETERGRLALEELAESVREVARWMAKSFSELKVLPTWEETTFGKDGPMPSLALVNVSDGWTVVVRGQLDRIDIGEVQGRRAGMVVDYKLREKSFDVRKWKGAENFQLPVYLLALEGLEEGAVLPAGAVYLGITIKREDREKEARSTYKGLVRLSVFDHVGGWNGKWGPGAKGYIQTAGSNPEEKYVKWGTVLRDAEFDRILDETRTMIVETARDIIDGRCAVSPSRIVSQSPCTYCPFMAVCRLDYRVNRARLKEPGTRASILTAMREEAE